MLVGLSSSYSTAFSRFEELRAAHIAAHADDASKPSHKTNPSERREQNATIVEFGSVRENNKFEPAYTVESLTRLSASESHADARESIEPISQRDETVRFTPPINAPLINHTNRLGTATLESRTPPKPPESVKSNPFSEAGKRTETAEKTVREFFDTRLVVRGDGSQFDIETGRYVSYGAYGGWQYFSVIR